jgi:hypothetical protein
MQLLFSFDRGMRVEKTLMQTLASQLSCNSCSRLIGARELGKLSCKLSLLSSHQLSCNSCSRLTGARELRKLSCKLSTLINTHSRLTRTLLNRYECTWVRGCSLVCPCLGNTYSSASYNYKVQLYIFTFTNLSYNTTSGFHTREGRIFILVMFMKSAGFQDKLGLFQDFKDTML